MLENYADIALPRRDAGASSARGPVDQPSVPIDPLPLTISATNQAAEIELPAPRGFWLRRWTHYTFSHYRRLAVLVLVVNGAWLGYGLMRAAWWSGDGIALGALSNLVVANITLAILIRQQYVINLLFWLATRAPTSWPLAIRWQLGKVYHFGGLHMGGALAGTIWFAIFTGSLTYHLAKGLPGVSVVTATMSYLLLAMLLLLVVLALPALRARYHDLFERSHRLGGWAALLIFWVQTVSFINDTLISDGLIGNGEQSITVAQALATTPAVWALLLVTLSVLLPWLRLRKTPVRMERPSTHVVLARFNYGVTPMAGSSTAVSRNPLLEWHSFANVPTPGQEGFRLTISRAGDWTGALIDDMPSHLWVKGIPTAGVANIEVLFKRVIYVATGSGIGPCLPHLLAQEVPARLIWSTRDPHKTYGDALVDEILAVQPDALIWDTGLHGRPDLVQLAYAACKSFDAEAVICISNQKLTRQVVYGMECRGIPAYGAIWDS